MCADTQTHTCTHTHTFALGPLLPCPHPRSSLCNFSFALKQGLLFLSCGVTQVRGQGKTVGGHGPVLCLTQAGSPGAAPPAQPRFSSHRRLSRKASPVAPPSVLPLKAEVTVVGAATPRVKGKVPVCELAGGRGRALWEVVRICLATVVGPGSLCSMSLPDELNQNGPRYGGE